MDIYLEQTVNPLLEQMVALLLQQRPVDPVPLLIQFLQGREKEACSIACIINAIKDSATPIEDEEAILSPTSTALLSPSHSPSNIAKYYERGARLSVSATPTDDLMKRFANLDDSHCSKTEAEIEYLVNLLTQTSLALGRSEEELKAMAQEMDRVVFEQIGTNVEFQGSILIVESGEIEKVCKSDDTDNASTCSIVTAGAVIGDIPALLHCPCDEVTLTTVTEKTVCWKLNAEFIDYIVLSSTISKREKHMHFLASVPILSSMDSEELFKICDALRQETFVAGQFIVRQSEIGNKFFILESGACVATKSYVPGQLPTEISRFGPGDYFGEVSLLHNEPRDANVIALTDTTVVSLDRKSFKRLLGPIENILRRSSKANDETNSLL